MKREIVTAIVFFVGFWVCASHVVAQPKVRYPNPAYMYWEEPCPEISGLSVTGMPHYCFFYYPIRTQDGIAQNQWCYINPFGIKKEEVVYGVALCIYPIHNDTPPFMPIDRRVTLDVRLYHITPGDSSVQLLKSQTFEVEQNQRNDLVMVYRDAFYIQHPELANDSLVRLPMYEFYFDSPIGIEGDFYVGIHSEDSLLLYHGWRNKMNEVSCCQHGYEGIIHMARNVLLDGWSTCYHSGPIDEISWIPHHPILAPQTDTIFTFVSQAIFPIIRPQGYLTATAPTMEGENVRLLPNPARTRVSVEASAPIRSVDVTDMMGRSLMEKQYTGDAQTVVLDVAALSQGSYVVRVRTDKEETTLKLLIER